MSRPKWDEIHDPLNWVVGLGFLVYLVITGNNDPIYLGGAYGLLGIQGAVSLDKLRRKKSRKRKPIKENQQPPLPPEVL